MNATLVETTSVTVRYGTATALDGVSIRVAAGELVALIGPNGAGKTTLVNTLAGILRPAAGTVAVRGRLGVVPEGRQVFGSLSVEDNLQLGAWRTRQRTPPGSTSCCPTCAGSGARPPVRSPVASSRWSRSAGP